MSREYCHACGGEMPKKDQAEVPKEVVALREKKARLEQELTQVMQQLADLGYQS